MIRNKENSHLFKYDTNKHIREQIDKCLEKINSLHAQYIGLDCTKEEYEIYLQEIEPYKEKISGLDIDYYKTIWF